ncbi:MAG: hypothetical protein ACXAC7_10075, partial [Candidatus Hodarchaeales archaeon]
VFYHQEKELIQVMKFIGLPPRLKSTFALSPYKVAVILFKNYVDKNELFTELNNNSFNNFLASFFVKYLIYLNNTPLTPENRIFFKKMN